ncbi:MAG: hypothetical protein WCG30_00745 [Candidatus Saccharibacteria bacterium]
MDKNFASKRVQLNKANQLIFISVAISVFIVIFTIFAAKNLISQGSYLNRVIAEKKKAYDVLTADNKAISNLETSYRAFINQPQNMIGGAPNGLNGNDGNNAKIVLDALPTSSDVNAWTLNFVNLNSLLGQQSDFMTVGAAAAVAAPVASKTNTTSPGLSVKPSTVTLSVTGSFKADFPAIPAIFASLNQPIIPIQVKSMSFAAGTSTTPAVVSFTASTFYQPPYQFSIGKEIVK